MIYCLQIVGWLLCEYWGNESVGRSRHDLQRWRAVPGPGARMGAGARPREPDGGLLVMRGQNQPGCFISVIKIV